MATLKDEKILESWASLLEGAGGNGEEIFKNTKANIQTTGAQGISYVRESVKPGWIKGLLGKKRDFLMVTHESLKDYRMYVGARDYGNCLDVTWFLTVEPGFFKKRFSSVMSGGNTTAMSFNLDIFDQQDLRAYVTVVHYAMLKAVEDLLMSLGKDASKIDRKSKGFLGIS